MSFPDFPTLFLCPVGVSVHGHLPAGISMWRAVFLCVSVYLEGSLSHMMWRAIFLYMPFLSHCFQSGGLDPSGNLFLPQNDQPKFHSFRDHDPPALCTTSAAQYMTRHRLAYPQVTSGRVLFIGTRYSNLYTAVDTPAHAAWLCVCVCV